MNRLLTTSIALLVFLLGTEAGAQVTVWVDFASDTHNGVGGGPNGIPDWVDELDKATASAGVTTFTAAERATIESSIMSDLSTIYSGYSISFTTTVPGSSPFDAIAFGATSFGFGALGVAPLDVGNIASGQVASVAPGNFDFILDEFTGSGSRATQIAQISTALAGTGAHELLHSLGGMHHHAYSNPGIHPGTYGATGGLQNLHIMATGPTGLTETGREVLRSLSPWERAMLDVTGGAAAAYPTFDNQSAVSSPVTIDLTEDGAFDAGSSLITSMPISLMPGETSGFDLALVAADIDGSPGDVDVFKFFLGTPGTLMAEIFSENRFGSPFTVDTTLTLLDSTGTPMTMMDDLFYLDDVFGAGVFHENDPFLLNIPIVTPGMYFLSVTGSPTPSFPTSPGDAYWLMVGFNAVPEPGIGFLLALVATPLLVHRRRRVN
jgi:hypothetical protein